MGGEFSPPGYVLSIQPRNRGIIMFCEYTISLQLRARSKGSFQLTALIPHQLSLSWPFSIFLPSHFSSLSKESISSCRCCVYIGTKPLINASNSALKYAFFSEWTSCTYIFVSCNFYSKKWCWSLFETHGSLYTRFSRQYRNLREENWLFAHALI